jgi:hypothetical protein
MDARVTTKINLMRGSFGVVGVVHLSDSERALVSLVMG